jgi:threonine synthase
VKYVSTRGAAPVLGFDDVLLAGLAADGGLYVPETWPTRPAAELAALADVPYAEAAVRVMAPFVEGGLDLDDLAADVAAAYATFDAPDVVPLTDLGGGTQLLELFHGPTLAFKDVALQVVGRLFDRELQRRGRRLTIVCATSGDTGSAAIEACRDRATLDVVVLHPAGRVSEVQRRQMTTVASPNIHNVAVEGTFDDCQDMVKAMFADEAFRSRFSLSAVNSINWARVVVQSVYYAVAAARLGATADRPVGFSVPTGNFGNVFAGWVARQMGAPVGRLLVATNRNDILARWLGDGVMAVGEVHPTLSPSMDIQVSSNVERLLFEVYGRRGSVLAEHMAAFRAGGRLDVGPERLAAVREVFDGVRVDDDETLATMRAVHDRLGVLLDPHTAVGVAGAARRRPGDPTVVLATAHPAKFPDAVEAATGVRPPLPAHLADLFERPERATTLPNDLATVQEHIATVVPV